MNCIISHEITIFDAASTPIPVSDYDDKAVSELDTRFLFELDGTDRSVAFTVTLPR